MFRLCAQMKLDEVKPNIITYHLLLQTCCHLMLDQESWAIFEDMIAMGIQPDAQVFESLLSVTLFPILGCLRLLIRHPDAGGPLQTYGTNLGSLGDRVEIRN